MLIAERRCIILLSTITLGLYLQFGIAVSTYFNIYILITPLYLFTIFYINKSIDRKERVELAVSSCLDESEFNVIDKIEQLRKYFYNTTDVIEYLSAVDTRLLTYVFNQSSLNLKYKDFVSGAITCLAIFKQYDGGCYFNIDIVSISKEDKISTLLSTLYMVSKQIDSGSDIIYITSRQIDDGVYIDVTDKYHSSSQSDTFCKKLLDIFSNNQFILSSKSV